MRLGGRPPTLPRVSGAASDERRSSIQRGRREREDRQARRPIAPGGVKNPLKCLQIEIVAPNAEHVGVDHSFFGDLFRARF